MTKHIHANSIKEAWSIADKLFPSDYELNDHLSERCGYPVWTSTADTYRNTYTQIDDLNTRLEVIINGELTYIHIDDEPEEETAEAAEAAAEAENEAEETEREITESELDEAVAEAVQEEIDAEKAEQATESEPTQPAEIEEWEREQIIKHIDFERYILCGTLDSIEAEYSRRADEAKDRPAKQRELLKVVRVVREMQEEEKARLLSDSAIDEALAIVDETLYQIDDKINPVLRDALGFDAARSALYAAFEKAAQLVKPESPVFTKYNLKDA